MASQKRKRHKADFKARVALEALRGQRTTAQIASEYKISAVQVSQWKQQLIKSIPEIFSSPVKQQQDTDELTDPLYREIGKLKMELEWLKKKLEPFH